MSEIADVRIRGAGIGLRSQHHQEIIARQPAVPWLEVLSENYYAAGGTALANLEQIRNLYPITLHGVGMSLGSTDPLNFDYLARLKSLADRFEPEWLSDHLAWISVGEEYVHDLLPLPYTQEALDHVVARIDQVQDFLGRRILIENPSTYLSYRDAEMSEWEFVREVAESSDCDILFDVNNAYVNASNHDFAATNYLDALPASRVREIHLAGFAQYDNYLFDTHGERVHPPVWELYQLTIERIGPVPTLIEWDTDIPDLEVLVAEAEKAQTVLEARSCSA